MKTLVFVFLIALSHSAYAGSTRCLVYVSSSYLCAGAVAAGQSALDYYKVNAYFVDTDAVATVNAGRCLERAKEYKAWCSKDGLNANWAVTYFQTENGSTNAIAAIEGSDDKTYLSDGNVRYLRWHD
jgi:hypothetical protein